MLFSVVIRNFVLAGILAIVLVIPVIAYAMDATGDGQQARQIEERDAAIQASDIDEQKKKAVLKIYYKYDAIKEEIQKERAIIYTEIKRLVDAGKATNKPDEHAISTQLNKLDATNSRWQNAKKSKAAELKVVLKPSEEAELILAIKTKKR